MLVNEVTTSGGMPALEMLIRFSGQRQRIIANNIANLETPNYQPKDVSVADFQRMLGDAIDERRTRNGGMHGPLKWEPTREVSRAGSDGMRLMPRTPSGNVLFHDRNNRDVERTMQDLVENASVFRTATELYRQQNDLLKAAVTERP